MITLKETYLEQGRSSNGGWSKEQLALLGVEWPPPKGWKKRLVGEKVAKDKYIKFVKLKDKHIT